MDSSDSTSSEPPNIAQTPEAFILPNVRQTGRSLGRGSFGSVEELKVNGLMCAGKRMFDVLVNPNNEGADRMIEKYYDECQLLSSLRHPNIVQFLGICFLETQPTSTANLPVLVMEMLQGSLDDLLENTPNVPLAKKCSILQDVARGLVYLHGHSPAIIHRDLTAKNVLLNSAMVAKIADMGNSRIVNTRALVTASQLPGTLVYMPPEAMDPSRYNTSLDMFSFGHLALFTVTQEFPKDLLPPNFKDPKTGRLLGRTEIKRRGKYVNILEDMLDKSHALVQLIKECLDFEPGGRPMASDALQRLERISSTIVDECHSMTRLDLEKLVTAQRQQMELLEPLANQGLEKLENDLLKKLKEKKGKNVMATPTATPTDYVDSMGIRYNMTQGDIEGNTIDVMILVAVGNRFPDNLVVKRRIPDPILAEIALKEHGQLPSFITGLHKEAAADLMATTSSELKSTNVELVRICLDTPIFQRSKHYYLTTIADFFKNSKHPVVAIDYLGHSEKHTGNWCFKDGTISYRDIVTLYMQHCAGKLLTVQSDCCYSGQWVLDCARFLDNYGITPCGHRARERKLLLRVFASCQPNQRAVEPCYSVEAMMVSEEGIAVNQVMQHRDQKSAWFSGTKLVCCKGPDSPCPRGTFAQLKWMDGVNKCLPIETVQREEGGEDKWYFIMLKDTQKETAQAFRAEVRKNPSLKLSKWGYVLLTGSGEEIPSAAREMIATWTAIAA